MSSGWVGSPSDFQSLGDIDPRFPDKPEPWEKVRVYKEKKCCVTNKVMPAFSKVWRKRRYMPDGKVASTWWMTDMAYTFEAVANRL